MRCARMRSHRCGPVLPCPAALALQPAVYSFEQAVQHSGWEGFTVEFAWTPYPSHFVVAGMNGAARVWQHRSR